MSGHSGEAREAACSSGGMRRTWSLAICIATSRSPLAMASVYGSSYALAVGAAYGGGGS